MAFLLCCPQRKSKGAQHTWNKDTGGVKLPLPTDKSTAGSRLTHLHNLGPPHRALDFPFGAACDRAARQSGRVGDADAARHRRTEWTRGKPASPTVCCHSHAQAGERETFDDLARNMRISSWAKRCSNEMFSTLGTHPLSSKGSEDGDEFIPRSRIYRQHAFGCRFHLQRASFRIPSARSPPRPACLLWCAWFCALVDSGRKDSDQLAHYPYLGASHIRYPLTKPNM